MKWFFPFFIAGAAFAHGNNPGVDDLSPEMLTIYEEFVAKPGHRAFAWNGEEAWGYSYNATSRAEALDLALTACDEKRGSFRILGGGDRACRPIAYFAPEG